jgi:hypothetical protein
MHCEWRGEHPKEYRLLGKIIFEAIHPLVGMSIAQQDDRLMGGVCSVSIFYKEEQRFKFLNVNSGKI